MQFFNPWAGLFALTVPVIIILYLLKMRRREVEVSSTFLWQQVLKDARANAPWQKLTKNILLLLQILIALALVFALLRPFLPVSGTQGRSLVVLLDASGSMQGVDVNPNRFEGAKEEIRVLIDDLGAQDGMTIVKMAEVPEVVVPVTSDKSALKSGLNKVKVTNGEADLGKALSLATSLEKGMNAPVTVIVSDGGVKELPDNTPLPTQVEYLPVGVSNENLNVAALATRREGNSRTVFSRVKNNGSKEIVTTVELWIEGKLYDARVVKVEGGKEKSIYWNEIPLEATVFMARSTYPDILLADNTAWTVAETPEKARVLLVSKANLFVEKVLALNSALEAAKTTPEQYSGEMEYDLVIFDGWLPEVLPRANMLIFNPPIGNGLVPSGEYIAGGSIGVSEKNNPLVSYVDFSDVHVARNRNMKNIPGGKVLVKSNDIPLITAGSIGNSRVVVFGFNLHHSDLPLRTAFPILMQNVLTWLVPQTGSGMEQILAGEIAYINPQPQAESLSVKKPDGSVQKLPLQANLLFTDTVQPGIYTVIQKVNNQEITGHFAVNFPANRESKIAPGEIKVSGTQGENVESKRLTNKELWQYFAWVALLILVLEGWVYARGY